MENRRCVGCFAIFKSSASCLFLCSVKSLCVGTVTITQKMPSNRVRLKDKVMFYSKTWTGQKCRMPIGNDAYLLAYSTYSPLTDIVVMTRAVVHPLSTPTRYVIELPSFCRSQLSTRSWYVPSPQDHTTISRLLKT